MLSVCFVYQMREAVRDVARYFPTAIVSGRCRAKVHFQTTAISVNFGPKFYSLLELILSSSLSYVITSSNPEISINNI